MTVARCARCGVYVSDGSPKQRRCANKTRCDLRVQRGVWLDQLAARVRGAGWNASP